MISKEEHAQAAVQLIRPQFFLGDCSQERQAEFDSCVSMLVKLFDYYEGQNKKDLKI